MARNQPKLKLLLFAIFVSFFTYGLFMTASGSLTAPLMSYYKINEAQRGLLILLQDMGGMCVVLFSAFFGERFNKLKLYMLGVLLLGVTGLAIAGITSIVLYAALLVFWCAGTLLIDVMSNAIVSDLFREEQDKYIPFLHLYYGAGAVLSNIAILFLLDRTAADSWKTVYLVFGVLNLAAVILLFIFVRKAREIVPYQKAVTVRQEKVRFAEIIRMPDTWKIFFSVFLFGVFFTAFSTWLPYYWEKGLSFSRTFSLLALSVFFAGVLVMRFLSPALLKRFSPQALVLWGSIGGGVMMALSVLLHVPALTVALTVAGGFFTGADYPMLALIACRTYPDRTSFASSLVLFAYMLSSLLTPWITGVISTNFGMLLALLLVSGCLALCGPVAFTVKKDVPLAAFPAENVTLENK
jgi:fucose permease